MNSKNLKLYFIFTYILFWCLIGLTGFLISLEVPLIFQNIMKNVSAWSPTFVLLIMFKKLYPDTTLRDFLRKIFTKKVISRHFILLLILQLTILIAAVLAYLIFHNLSIKLVSLIGAAGLIPAFIMSLTSGAMGEELGWRAYALNEFQKKFTPLKSALIVGFVWGFWHLPLWFFSGYIGLELFCYSIAFIIGILSLSVVITFFYNKEKSILLAMWIHFLFNFFMQLVMIDPLQLLIFISGGYLIFALILIIIFKQEFLVKPIKNEAKH